MWLSVQKPVKADYPRRTLPGAAWPTQNHSTSLISSSAISHQDLQLSPVMGVFNPFSHSPTTISCLIAIPKKAHFEVENAVLSSIGGQSIVISATF
jgi:hypothetical protein